MRGAPHPGDLPALIISGCRERYERAAEVARAARLSPSWMVGVFRQNVAVAGRCGWPSQVESHLLAAHRNAWSLIATTNVSMLILEDDVELVSSAAALHHDIFRCKAAGTRCKLLYAGLVDSFWSTHALYVTPQGAHWLLGASRAACAAPTDYHTRRLCDASETTGSTSKEAKREQATSLRSSWHRTFSMAAHCMTPSFNGALSSGFLVEEQRLARGRAADSLNPPHAYLRAPELYGVGHFVQNRSLGAYIHRVPGASRVAGIAADGQGSNC
jgi:hypothetical protein